MQRVLTAVVLLAVLVPAAFWAPSWLWLTLMALAAAVSAWEWARLAGWGRPAAMVYGALNGGLAGFAGGFLALFPWQFALMGLAVVFWSVLAPLWLARHWRLEQVWVRAPLGVVVVVPTALSLVFLREAGPWLMIAVMAVVWIGDSAAYYAGRRFGSHKLAPGISPGKTWEGVAGAVLALVLYAITLSAGVHGLRIVASLMLVLVLLYFAILGDLFESWIKRVAGAKDSSQLLPGHGGVLDRVDALTAALPVAATLLIYALHIQP
jgi:phosphatidate cytidylyltransferase